MTSSDKQSLCPRCNAFPLTLSMMSFEMELLMCPNVQCLFPFDEPTIQPYLYPRSPQVIAASVSWLPWMGIDALASVMKKETCTTGMSDDKQLAVPPKSSLDVIQSTLRDIIEARRNGNVYQPTAAYDVAAHAMTKQVKVKPPKREAPPVSSPVQTPRPVSIDISSLYKRRKSSVPQ